MKRTLVFLLMFVFMGANSEIRAQKPADRIVVAYFSATGTTAWAAREVARITGGALHAIEPAEPYTAADLDWHDSSSRSSVEMADSTCRPALAEPAPDLTAYDRILVGFPIWWGVAPRVVDTFLDQAQDAGAKVVLFATSGSSTMHDVVVGAKRLHPKLEIASAALLNGKDAAAWAKAL